MFARGKCSVNGLQDGLDEPVVIGWDEPYRNIINNPILFPKSLWVERGLARSRVFRRPKQGVGRIEIIRRRGTPGWMGPAVENGWLRWKTYSPRTPPANDSRE